MFAFAEIITMGDIFGYDFPEIVVSGLQSSNQDILPGYLAS